MTPKKLSVLETPLYKKVYDLNALLFLFHPRIPKSHRYTLWQRCENCALTVLEMLMSIGYLPQEERKKPLMLMGQKVDLLKTLIRLARETQALSSKDYIALQTVLQEVGKMVGGWLKFASR